MKHLILVGACYLDTILSVPHFPEEDSKLRATDLSIRRGGNCPNSLEVLQQLLHHSAFYSFSSSSSLPSSTSTSSATSTATAQEDDVKLHLVTCLPAKSSPATRRITASFNTDGHVDVDLSHCLYREEHAEAASCHVLRSLGTGSRTLVSYSDLPEMTAAELETVARAFVSSTTSKDDEKETWWHFEVREKKKTRDTKTQYDERAVIYEKENNNNNKKGPDSRDNSKLYPPPTKYAAQRHYQRRDRETRQARTC
jgi:ketohexokinase